ncbi:MAG: hypothetical protein CK427_02565 [Leptospira sp.]|nr:MAG: hypothetical protein CK427_02565 [Leptospira sp.]
MNQMKSLQKLTFIFILSSLMILLNCNFDSDAFASFEGGIVTRKEVRDFYEIRGLKITDENASISKQANLVEQIALQKIVYNDFSKSGKYSKEFLDSLVRLTKGQILLSLYKKSFEENKLKKTPMELIDMQMLVLRDQDNSLDEKGQELLAKLNATSSQSEINKIIIENTQDETRKAINGMIEPFCLNCGPNPFEDVLSEAIKSDDKKFYLKKAGGVIYIVRNLGIRKIHEAAIGRYLTKAFKNFETMAKEYEANVSDENAKQSAKYYSESEPEERGIPMGEQFSRQFKASLWQEELERIKNESKIEVPSPPELQSPDQIAVADFPDNRVLANLADSSAITIGSFKKEFKELSSVLGKGTEDGEKQELWDMLNFFYNIYLSSLYLQEDSKSKDIVETQLYEDSLEYLRYSLTWALFMKEISNEKVEVSEVEMRENYETGKMFSYSSPDPSNPQKKITKPYASVRLDILRDMENAKRKSIFDKKLDAMREKYKLVLNNEIFRNGKI